VRYNFSNESITTITDFQSGSDTVDVRGFDTVTFEHVPLQFGSARPGTE
jgi:hypothetical protein